MRKYHVAFSFAGENRTYVESVFSYLKENSSLKVFYDRDNEIHLWGKNLLETFQDIYTRDAHFVVMFISADYVRKGFPMQERRYALDRSIESAKEYILLAKFDGDIDVPGIPTSMAYIDLSRCSPEEFAQKIIKKMTERGLYFGEHVIQKSCSVNKFRSDTISRSTVTIKSENGAPIESVDVWMFKPNGTHNGWKSNANGQATFTKMKSGDFYTVFCAHPDYPAVIVDNHEAGFDISISMNKSSGIGSTMFDSTGYLPGLKGRLNPILDSSKRTYIYGDNIAINGSVDGQPKHFEFGENINLEDCDGNVVDIRILRIIGECAILNYKPHTA